MKLFYYQDPIGNFGDDLNPWIWNSLAPEIFDDDDSMVLVGIGTLINSRAPEKPVKLVFGSGVGYHEFPNLDEKWKFICVRGPLSAARLGLDKSYAISDPAVLLTQVTDPVKTPATNIISYMPHHASSRFADWRSICQQAGIVYMDPADSVEESVARIRQSKLVIAEAMHAAIIADAFRVPWIPVTCYDHILEFKWMDWCQSLKLEYKPEKLPRIWDMERNLSFRDLFKTRVKRGLINLGVPSENWTPPVPKTNKKQMEERVVSSLVKIATSGRQFLSEDIPHFESIDRLLEKLNLLKKTGRASRGNFENLF